MRSSYHRGSAVAGADMGGDLSACALSFAADWASRYTARSLLLSPFPFSPLPTATPARRDTALLDYPSSHVVMNDEGKLLPSQGIRFPLQPAAHSWKPLQILLGFRRLSARAETRCVAREISERTHPRSADGRRQIRNYRGLSRDALFRTLGCRAVLPCI